MLFGITFSALNANAVWFNYYFASKQLPLAILLVAAFGFGILIGIIFSLFTMFKLKRETSRFKSRLKVVEQELANLRSSPLKEE